MRFIPLERLINLEDGYRRRFDLGGQSILLAQEEGEVFAFARHCPHQHYTLDYARIENGALYCSAHGFEFNLRRFGDLIKPQGFPCNNLKVYDLHYEGDKVGIMI